MVTEKNKTKTILLWILIGVLLVAIAVVFVRFARKPKPEIPAVTPRPTPEVIIKEREVERIVETEKVITAGTIQDGLRDMGKLVTEEYYFTEVLSNKKTVSFLFPIGDESYMVRYDGYIPAGIDFSRIGVTVDEDARTITVSLPEAEMKDPVIDYESIQILDEKHTIFTDITAEERNKAVLEFQENARKKALEKGILKRADENAELVVKNFVMSTAGPEYHVTLERRP